ncbi:hypothetical protein BDW_03230 [Bdellovibrio bacteriovorus W]|nr:hypothetical protein BDW_03230 [Bdellovibrio bacteriovorus W]
MGVSCGAVKARGGLQDFHKLQGLLGRTYKLGIEIEKRELF